MFSLLLLATSGTAAIPNVDKDAVCLSAVTAALYYFYKETEADQKEMHLLKEDFENGLTFYTGSLTRTLSGAELDATVSAARTAVAALPVKDQQQLVPDCLANVRTQIGLVKQALLKK
ncbi:hypothetical protein [Sphingomonas bacterium]|uniref:hypothetical protein n=1 Tax=Sphingomonas bacterium TaxID=1895847 RepID=UPI002629CF06|nr:hypothetical protein [Sphingomonas bacterium]MDB5679834.1 hypothetical protein [Sphingomonas bacterium]